MAVKQTTFTIDKAIAPVHRLREENVVIYHLLKGFSSLKPIFFFHLTDGSDCADVTKAQSFLSEHV